MQKAGIEWKLHRECEETKCFLGICFFDFGCWGMLAGDFWRGGMFILFEVTQEAVLTYGWSSFLILT